VERGKGKSIELEEATFFFFKEKEVLKRCVQIYRECRMDGWSNEATMEYAIDGLLQPHLYLGIDIVASGRRPWRRYG
jgi:hypothetical protein